MSGGWLMHTEAGEVSDRLRGIPQGTDCISSKNIDKASLGTQQKKMIPREHS
jgi:hypothetical protein